MKHALRLALLISLHACTLDLDLPETPLRGTLKGTVDTQGHITPGQRDVVLIDSRGGRTTTQTDDQGAFVFSDLGPGAYTLSLKLPGFAPYSEPGLVVRTNTETDAGSLAPAWLQGTAEEGTLTGKVVVTQGGDVTGTKVEFTQGTTLISSTSVPIDGAFTVRLPPGTYSVRARHPWYSLGQLDDVTLGTGEKKDITTTPVAMDINPAVITGQLLLEQEDAPAAPQAGVNVLLDNGRTTITDAQGRFTIDMLSAGNYAVSFSAQRHVDSVPSRAVRLEPSMTTDLGSLTLGLVRGRIKGTVKMADNTPIDGAQVTVTGKRYGATVSPDGADPSIGRFEIRDVPLGTYEVVATRERYSRFTAQANVTAAGDVDVGTLTLALLLGDFDIDDNDPVSLTSFTRVRAVELVFNRFPTNGSVASFRASEDSTFGGGAQPFAPYTGIRQAFTLSTGDGKKTVYAQYKDTAGVSSGTFTSSITLDTAAPVLNHVAFAQTSGTQLPVKFNNSTAGSISLAIAGADPAPAGPGTNSGVATMRVGAAVDGMGNVTAPGLPYQSPYAYARPLPLMDGPMQVYVQLVDNAGNVSTARTDTVVIDTVAPSGSVTVQRGADAEVNGFTNNPIVSLALTAAAEPNGGLVQVKLANASGLELDAAQPRSVTPTVTWFLEPNDGAKTVYATFVDSAGNVSMQATSNITLDTVPPSPASVSLTTPAISSSLTAGLSFTTNAADLAPMTGLTVSENLFFQGAGTVGPMALPMTSALAFTLSASDGAKTVYVRFRDRAGNEALSQVNVTIDRLAPTLVLAVRGALADGTPSSLITASATVSVDLTSNEAVSYVLGNESLVCPAASAGAWAALTSATIGGYSLATSTTSPRQVKACVKDAAGNITGPVRADIALDSSVPSGCTLTLTGSRADGPAAPPAGKTANPNVRVGLACSEVPAEVFLTQDPTVTCAATTALPWVPYSASATTSYLLSGANGLNTVRGCVRDAARNVGSLPQTTITLDTQPPDSVSVVIDTGAEFINAATVGARGGNIGQVTGFANGAVEWALSETPGTFSNWSAYPGTQPRAFTFASTGVRTLYASFRDDVGNVSASPFDQIDIDVTAPVPGTAAVTLRSNAPNAEYTGSVSVIAELTNSPGDAWQVKLGESAGAATCTTGVVSGALPLPLATNYTFLLTQAQGLKRLCVQFIDRAGNAGSAAQLVSDTITLDTIPPTALQIVTPAAYVNAAAGASFDVVTGGGSSDASPVTYAQLGGSSHPSWNTPPNQVSATPLTFRFGLLNSGGAAGSVNDLRLKAIDAAGNESGVSSVLITADNVNPTAVTTNAAWVDNTSEGSTLFWQNNAPDVASYVIRYGPTAADLSGTYASQGISPITTPAIAGATTASFTLTNLPNGSPTFVTITPVDKAGNLGTPSPTLQLQPNEVSPNLVATLTLSASGTQVLAERMTSMGTMLYLAGPMYMPGSCTGGTALLTIDTRNLESPVQSGQLQLAPAQPAVRNTQTFSDGLTCGGIGPDLDLLIDGNYLFLSSGTHVRIFDLSDPAAPALSTDINLAALQPMYASGMQLTSMAIIGDRLFVRQDWAMNFFAYQNIYAISLAKLYDNNSSTRPNLAADVVAVVSTQNSSGDTLIATRDRLMTFEAAQIGGVPYVWNVNETVDGDAVNSMTFVNQPPATLGAAGKPIVSGNYVYGGAVSLGFSVMDITQVWAAGFPNTPIVYSTAATASGQLAMHGTEAFLVDNSGVLRGLDLGQLGSMRETSIVGGVPKPGSGTPTGSHVHTLGNYAAIAGGPTLSFYELATPRAMRLRSSVQEGGYRPIVHGAFVVQTGNNRVYDVQKPQPQYQWPDTPTSYMPSTQCTTSIAMMDDAEISAVGNLIRYNNHEKEFDRNAATFPNVYNTDIEELTLPAASGKVTDVDVLGNLLVATEVRTDGIWVEVIDARKWRDRDPNTEVTSADIRSAFRVVAMTTNAQLNADSTFWGSKAVVTIDTWLGGTSISDNVFIVELQALLDDDAATTTPQVVATFQTPRARLPAIFPPDLAVPTWGGVYVFDATEAFDGNAGTTVPAGRAPRFTLGVNQFDQVVVHGSYLFAVPSFVQTSLSSMPVYDISGTTWFQTASMPVVLRNGGLCFVNGDARQHRNGIDVKGSRAWLNIDTTLREISLE